MTKVSPYTSFFIFGLSRIAFMECPGMYVGETRDGGIGLDTLFTSSAGSNRLFLYAGNLRGYITAQLMQLFSNVARQSAPQKSKRM